MINAFDKWELAPGNRTRSVRTNEIAQTPLEVSIEGSRTLISHLPSALIINQISISHPTRRCQVCIRLKLCQGGNHPRAVKQCVRAAFADVRATWTLLGCGVQKTLRKTRCRMGPG